MVKKLSRDSIQRMVRGGGSTGYSTGGAGGGGVGISMGDVWSAMAGGTDEQINGSHLTDALTGYATQNWVGQNYLSIAFFSQLFKVYKPGESAGDPDVEVTPNTIDQDITNIKAMFGFWTEFYISALGTGGQSTVGLRLASLADVNVAGVQNGQVLAYDSTSGKWIASTPQSGTNMATVWANLADNGNQQINYSHLSGAVSLSNGTITIGSSSITPITSLAGYAQETWVNNNFLKLSGGTMTGAITMKANQYSPYYGLNMNNSDIINVNAIRTSDLADSWDEGLLFARSNGNWDSFWASNGNFYFSSNSGTTLATLDNDGLYLNGSNGWIRTYGSCGWYSQSHGGGWYMEDDYWIRSYGNKYVYINSNLASEHIYAGGGSYNANYPLYINGVGYASSGFYTAGYVTALSDVRHKNVIGDTGLTVEQIAEAPAIRFTWKDRDDQSVFAGSIAQYWQKVLPEVVKSQADGTLSLDYQVTALMASIVTARKVNDHEQRIRQLETEIAKLRSLSNTM